MSKIFENLSVDDLISESLQRGEGEIAANGALLVKTGKRTGRSPLDRFIVSDDSTKDSVDWGEVNRPFESKAFERSHVHGAGIRSKIGILGVIKALAQPVMSSFKIISVLQKGVLAEFLRELRQVEEFLGG